MIKTPFKAQNVRVTKDTENPETPEVLAAAILRIANGFQELVSQGLTKKAIIVLIQNMRGVDVSQRDIETVLDNLPKLASYYIQ